MHRSWPIEEFSRSIGAESLAMLTAFLDDTGTHLQSHAVGIFGMLGSMAEWSRIERAWQQHLRSFGLSSFHAVDCEQRKKAFERMEVDARDELRRRLIGVIGNHRAFIVGATVIRKDWDEVVPEEIRSFFRGDPIYFCFEHCLQQLCNWSRDYQASQSVAVVFAEQEQHQRRIGELHDYYKNSDHFSNLGSFSISKPSLVPPLQVADFVAYESYQHMRLRETNEIRWQLRELLNTGVGNISQFHDRETLAAVIAAGPKKFEEIASTEALERSPEGRA